ncbi:MAG: rod shape-determining protein MreC [Armatimonadetes bacterium]|nr:rod shape-determining protein MreC [Armatimonadota bacterium]MDW8121982.1 rod shape-determining protein MreC [Armatimonadota bacterium]
MHKERPPQEATIVSRFFKKGIAVGLLLLIALTVGPSLLSAPADLLVRKSVGLTASGAAAFGTIKTWITGLTKPHQLAREAQKARRHTLRYMAQKYHLRELEEENRRLRRLLRMAETAPKPYLTARVMAVGGSNWFRTAVISTGEVEGCQGGSPVLDGHGVVGRLLDVNRHHSVVLLITDRRSAVGVALKNHPGVYGIVKGDGRDGAVLENLSRLVLPREGEELITSGLGGVFPKGLPVGKVAKVDPSSGRLRVSVQIAARLNDLQEVLVLTGYPRLPGPALLTPRLAIGRTTTPSPLEGESSPR